MILNMARKEWILLAHALVAVERLVSAFFFRNPREYSLA